MYMCLYVGENWLVAEGQETALTNVSAFRCKMLSNTVFGNVFPNGVHGKQLCTSILGKTGNFPVEVDVHIEWEYDSIFQNRSPRGWLLFAKF